MKIISENDLEAKDIVGRRFVCHLPTEVVVTKAFQEIRLDNVYCYPLPQRFWGECGVKVAEVYSSLPPRYRTDYDSQPYLLEVHMDWGDDGHTEYNQEKYFIVLDHASMPWDNTKEYLKIIDDYYTNKEFSRVEQLGLFDWKYKFYS